MLHVNDVMVMLNQSIICYSISHMRPLFGEFPISPPLEFKINLAHLRKILRLLTSFALTMKMENKHLPFWIYWQLWKSWNDLIFKKINCELDSVIDIAKDDVVKWLMAQQANQSQTNGVRHLLW